MKRAFSIIICYLLLISCNKEDTGGVSSITYFAEIEVAGDSYIIVEKGSDFEDPGAVAFENGEEIDLEVDGVVDTEVPAVYYITYNATNSDGFSSSSERKVRVVELGEDIDDISGTYDGVRVDRANGGTVYITKIAQGVYEVDDINGGYYAQGLGYGSAYVGNAIFTQMSDGTFVGSQGYNAGFGLEVEAQNIVYDSSSKTISYFAYFPSADFGYNVVLTLVE